MKNKIKWSKPEVSETKLADIQKHLKAMATSLGPCTGGTEGGCSCAASCDPAMFYWSCTGHFWIITA